MKPTRMTNLSREQGVAARPRLLLRAILTATLLGLSLPIANIAQTVLPAKPAKSAKALEDDALQKAIDAVNREVEKSKKVEPPRETIARTSEAGNSAIAKTVPAKPTPPPRSGKPAAGTPAAAAAGQPPTTRITSEEDVDFRNKEGIIIFRKNALVDRSDLKIWCDELQISLNQQVAKKSEPGGTEPPPTKTPADDTDGFSAQNIKQAVAKSAPAGFVVIWRGTPKGEVVAMAREATYDGATGNITLKGVPEVLRDQKLHMSSGGETDQLVLMKNGNVKGGGSNRTAMVPAGEGRDLRRRILGHAPVRRGGPPAGGPPPASTPPSAPAALPPASVRDGGASVEAPPSGSTPPAAVPIVPK